MPKSAEEWANDLDKRIRQSVMNPGLEDFTESEKAGEMALMMGGVWFPKRWLIEVLHSYARECVEAWREKAIETAQGLRMTKEGVYVDGVSGAAIAAALRALPGETP